MPIEAVIFDLDGTLSSFNLDYKALRGDVREYLIKKGVPASVLKVNESIFDMLAKTEIYFKNKEKNNNAFEKARADCLALAEKYELEAAKTTSLLPGALETLKELKKLNLKLGLCTTSSETAVNYILDHFKIQEHFGVVVPRNMVKRVKPDTEQFLLALKTLGVNARSAVIVGDSTVDMESAKELKAIAVGLPTGYSTPKQLMSHGANYLITSLTDLPILVKEMNKTKA
jgi:HAD superfamily hydrolase (TIGR01509 family)